MLKVMRNSHHITTVLHRTFCPVRRMQVASGSRISGSLIAALEVLKQGDMAAVEAAVAALAWQQLATLDSSLLADLALLAAEAHAAGDAEAVQLYGKLLRHYAQVGVHVWLAGVACGP
jgi:hypothetical protein